MFLKIFLGLDALAIAILAINFLSSGDQINDSYLLPVFAALMLLSYSLHIKQPKLTVLVAALACVVAHTVVCFSCLYIYCGTSI